MHQGPHLLRTKGHPTCNYIRHDCLKLKNKLICFAYLYCGIRFITFYAMNIQTGENMNYARTVSSVQFFSQSHIAYSETVH